MTDALSAFMALYWLRPETAAWRTCDVLALTDVPFTGPIADLGCGDGLFSFTRAGGRLDPAFDMFLQVGNLENFFSGADIYDRTEAGVAVGVERQPGYRIAVGLDHKATSLAKAMALGLYDEVREADANLALPLESGRFGTIFSNMVYWLDNLPGALKECRRALDDGGRLVLTVPSETFMDYSFYQRLYVGTGDAGWKWLERIDRGRLADNVRLARGFADWKADFTAAGFKIAHHRRYLSRRLLQAWDIGLRPISPFLIRMANKLTPAERLEIKQQWIAELMPLIEPFCSLETEDDQTHPPGFFLFVLEKA